MKKKTQRQLERFLLYALIAIFIGGTLLLYLPVSNPAVQNSPAPALDQLPDAQQIPAEVQQQLQQKAAEQAPADQQAAPAQPNAAAVTPQAAPIQGSGQ